MDPLQREHSIERRFHELRPGLLVNGAHIRHKFFDRKLVFKPNVNLLVVIPEFTDGGKMPVADNPN
jgi:hypothetical protein